MALAYRTVSTTLKRGTLGGSMMNVRSAAGQPLRKERRSREVTPGGNALPLQRLPHGPWPEWPGIRLDAVMDWGVD